MYVVRVSKNPNFGPKTSCFGLKWLFLVVQKFSKVVRSFGLIESFQMRYHMTPYLKRCGWDMKSYKISLNSVRPPPVYALGTPLTKNTLDPLTSSFQY